MSGGPALFYRLAPTARLTPDGMGIELVNENARDCRTIAFDTLPEFSKTFLESLVEGIDAEGRAALVADLVSQQRVELLAFTETLRRRGWVVQEMRDAGKLLATSVIQSDWFVPQQADCGLGYVLSRFAHLRPLAGTLLLESPRSLARIYLSRGGMERLSGILVDGVDAGWDDDMATAAMVAMLVECGLFVRRNANGASVEEDDQALRHWDFHDLLFHARSRAGRHRDGYGKIYSEGRPIEDSDTDTAAFLSFEGEPIVLPKPDCEAPLGRDLQFSQVLNKRRSRRRMAGSPLDLNVLSQFLFASARIELRGHSEEAAPWRPFASAAGLNDIDLFLCVFNCEGLQPGLYHYDASDHVLQAVDAPVQVLKRLEDFSGIEPVGVHIVITARFGKMNVRYDSIAYSLILRTAGCLLQTMYLVATALDRSPCAIGAGDADVFARITGLPYEMQGPVGDFVLR